MSIFWEIPEICRRNSLWRFVPLDRTWIISAVHLSAIRSEHLPGVAFGIHHGGPGASSFLSGHCDRYHKVRYST